MAVTSFDPRQPQIQGASGKVGQILHGYIEAGSQSFLAGQLVYVNAGVVTVTADGDTPVMGIALVDGTDTSTTGTATIPVQVIGPDDEVLIQVTTAGTLQASDTTCKPGVGYDLETVSTNLHYIDSADATSNYKFIYMGPVLDSTGASTYWGRFRPYYLENQATAG